MKKTLVAIAALAVTGAFAQTTTGQPGVQITGNFNAGLVSNNYFGNKVSGIEQNGMGTSSIFFRGLEDLGGGLKAHFLHGTDIQFMTLNGDRGAMNNAAVAAQTVAGGAVAQTASTNTGAVGTFGNDQKLVGLSGGFGTVNFGAINNSSLYNGVVLFNPTVGTSYSGGYGSIICADPTCGVVRYDNTVEYKSPVMNGFQLFGQYAKKQSSSVNTNYTTTLGALNMPSMNEISAKYANGPLTVAATRLETDGTGVSTLAAAATKSNLDTYVGVYELNSSLRLGGLMQKVVKGNTTAASQTERSTTAMNAIYTAGNNTYMLTIGSAKENNAANANSGKSSKFTGVQYKYALSKMTSLEAKWESLKDEANIYTMPAQFGTTRGDNTRTRSTVGINMNF